MGFMALSSAIFTGLEAARACQHAIVLNKGVSKANTLCVKEQRKRRKRYKVSLRCPLFVANTRSSSRASGCGRQLVEGRFTGMFYRKLFCS